MAFDPNYSAPVNVNAIDANISVEDWDNTSKEMIKAAIRERRVHLAVGEENGLAQTVKVFYHQLRDIASGDLLSWAACSADTANHVFKLSVNKKRTSWTTTQLLRHKCYKERKSGTSIDSAELSKCRAIMLKGSCGAIIQDVKAFRLTEGPGIRYLIECAVEVGVALGRMPNKEEMRRIIPDRNANKSQIVSQHKEYRRKRLQHYIRLQHQKSRK